MARGCSKLTEQEKDEVVRMYLGNEKIIVICLEFNIYTTGLYDVLRERKVKFRGRPNIFTDRKDL